MCSIAVRASAHLRCTAGFLLLCSFPAALVQVHQRGAGWSWPSPESACASADPHRGEGRPRRGYAAQQAHRRAGRHAGISVTGTRRKRQLRPTGGRCSSIVAGVMAGNGAAAEPHVTHPTLQSHWQACVLNTSASSYTTHFQLHHPSIRAVERSSMPC